MSGVCPKCVAQHCVAIYQDAVRSGWEGKDGPPPLETLWDVIDEITTIVEEKYKPCDYHRSMYEWTLRSWLSDKWIDARERWRVLRAK